jgi:hypothetical protein
MKVAIIEVTNNGENLLQIYVGFETVNEIISVLAILSLTGKDGMAVTFQAAGL